MHNNFIMKELPETEKPYEKCAKYGAEYLSDADLIAVLIRTGTRGATSVELANQLLSKNQGGILNLYRMTFEELKQIPGIGKVKAIQLKCMAELSKRLAMTRRRQSFSLTDASSVAAYYMEQFRHEEKENLLVAMFDAKCSLLGDKVISVGTVNASLISPREIFLAALNQKAVQIVLLHNHPSGQPFPSNQDKISTEMIKKCGDLLGIRLADHIIIGDNMYYSFREKGLIT